MMKAISVSMFGGPEVLTVEHNINLPEYTDTQILIEVKAAGVNPIDSYIRSGTFIFKPSLPFTPGYDAAGIVMNVGSAVTRYKPGDRVYAIKCISGAYAEYTTTEETDVVHLPPNCTFQQGAGVGIPCYTAYRSLLIKGKEQIFKGNTVLIHGASGATGLACVQLTVARGMKVLGTAGTTAGMDLVRNQGATHVFNHREDGYTQKIMDATSQEGPSLIVEMLANVNLETDLHLIRRKGLIVVVGLKIGESIEINPLLLIQKECLVTGMGLFDATEDEWKEMHAEIAEGLKAGWLLPHISEEYKLDQAPIAHDKVVNSQGTLGKSVLVL